MFSLQKLKRFANKRHYIYFESSRHLATRQTWTQNEEKDTHFGFETVKESEKEQKGKHST